MNALAPETSTNSYPTLEDFENLHFDPEAFAAANPDLINASKALLASHYSKERLSSRQARQQFLMPDIAANE